MKKYTVVQIADILDTNPETVRRWIRDDKLEAEQASRKQGNLITAESLACFLDTSPKYARRAADKGLNLRFPVQVRIVESLPETRKNAPGRIYAGNPGTGKNRDSFAKVMVPKRLSRESILSSNEAALGLQIREMTSQLTSQQKQIDTLKRQIRVMKSGAAAVKKK